MENSGTALVMRIFISSTDKYRDVLLYEHIVLKAREQGLAGATVQKGILGYGTSSSIQSVKFWEVTEKLPVVVEIIDNETNILSFWETIKPALEEMRYGCLVITEPVDILMLKPGIRKV